MSTPTPTPRAGWSTPMLHVADVERSIRFYQLLGFELVDYHPDEGRAGWARVHCEGGAVMFMESEEPLRPEAQTFGLYLYTPDLPALRARLLAADVEVSEIARPEYMKSGEVHLRDPDGYHLLIGHWGDAEHEPWVVASRERIKKRADFPERFA